MTTVTPDPLSSRQDLVEVAVYERSLPVGLERIWENVLDWEHLPWLHRGSFTSIEAERAGPAGWCAKIGIQTSRAIAMLRTEVVLDRPRLRYVTRTLAGPGAGTEIWTSLTPRESRRTDIRVAFLLPVVGGVAPPGLGERLVATYARLWDEDEAMMCRRQALLDARDDAEEHPMGPSSIALGQIEALRSRLPLVMEAFGAPVRLLALGDAVVAHAATCPHLGGPLDAASVEDGRVVCPWHGYRFELATGRCDGRPLALVPRLRIAVDPASGNASLERGAGPG